MRLHPILKEQTQKSKCTKYQPFFFDYFCWSQKWPSEVIVFSCYAGMSMTARWSHYMTCFEGRDWFMTPTKKELLARFLMSWHRWCPKMKMPQRESTYLVPSPAFRGGRCSLGVGPHYSCTFQAKVRDRPSIEITTLPILHQSLT